MAQNGDSLYKDLQVPFPICTYSHMDAEILTINSSGALLNQGDILLDGKIMSSSFQNVPYLQFNGSYINISGALISNNDISLQGRLTSYSSSFTPFIDFNTSTISVSGAIVTNNDVSITGMLTNYNSSQLPYVNFSGCYVNVSGVMVANKDLSISGNITCYNSSRTPFLNFNGSSINVSSTLFNTNSGILFQNTGSDPGIPYCGVLPTTPTYPWALPGRLYYTTMNDSNGDAMKVLCIV